MTVIERFTFGNQ